MQAEGPWEVLGGHARKTKKRTDAAAIGNGRNGSSMLVAGPDDPQGTMTDDRNRWTMQSDSHRQVYERAYVVSIAILRAQRALPGVSVP